MKKNIALFTSTAIFVVLFYNQGLGINLSIFCVSVWVLLFFVTKPKYRTPTFWWLSASFALSIAGFAWYGDFHCFVAVLLSTFLLGFKAHYPKLNIATAPAGILYSYISMIIRVSNIQKWLPVSGVHGGGLKIIFSYILLPLFFVITFISVYAAGSDKFASMFTLTWNADLLQIAGLAVAGFVLMFGYFHFAISKPLIWLNTKMKDDFAANCQTGAGKGFQQNNVASLKRSGEISLILLNALLLFFIIIYCIEQFDTVQAAETLSYDLHERVYVLILSIAMAIAVIMIYFHGSLNFDKKNKLLVALSYIWICLNSILVLIVLFKNTEYIHAFGLTYKRIGVYIFLMLSLAGLGFTAYKILYKKTNTFLISRMLWITYATIITFSVVNWSWIVTKYNVSTSQKIDWDYLHSLRYNKQYLYNLNKETYPESKHESINADVAAEKQKPFLSSVLYYQFLNVSNKK